MIRITRFSGAGQDPAGRLPLAAYIEKSCFASPWDLSSILSVLESRNASLYLAEENGVPVSYCLAASVLDEAELLRIAVLPDYRRRGIADRLMKLLLSEWRESGIRQAFLEVRESNTAAVALYEKNGFRPVCIRKKYYDNGENAIVYTCELSKRSEEQ